MRINGLSEIAANFDGMLIDQFGVIHDGQTLYPGTLRVLNELKALGIPVAVMTNSGKRAEANRKRLVKMGVPRDCFVDAVSSGEVAFRALTTTRAFLIGKDGEDYGFDGVTFSDDPHDAEVMLILGSNAPMTSLDDYGKLFTGLDLPAICCNPDKLMLTPDGLMPAPGAIAALADDVEEFFPKSVGTIASFGLQDCKTLNTDSIYSAMYGAIQYLIKDRDELEKRIKQLENK